jgi:molybdopterin synthase sulfur carrier subunit
MQVTLHVPASLREYSSGQPLLHVEVADSATVGDLFAFLHGSYPGIAERVLDELGAVRQHVNIFVNGDSIRLGQGLQTQVEANAEIWIIPAVSGG